MTDSTRAAIKNRLAAAKSVLIVSHIRPDGDAVGALLGLGLALQDSGKQVQMVLADGVHPSFAHLEGASQVRTAPEGEFDTYIVVDCADFKRVGKPLEPFGQPDINIDHHVTNGRFGKLNLIVPEAVATSAILTDCLPEWGYTITPPVAAALMSGIVTDTLGFRTSNMTAQALRQAAVLMETGIDLPALYHRALVSRTFQAARYWGAGLSSLECSDGIVWGTLTLADRAAASYPGNDDADLINVISSIDGSAIGMIFVEQADGHVKISWRALQPGYDVSQVARHFNGGGHPAAAGADIPGKMDEIQPLVLKTTREMLGL